MSTLNQGVSPKKKEIENLKIVANEKKVTAPGNDKKTLSEVKEIAKEATVNTKNSTQTEKEIHALLYPNAMQRLKSLEMLQILAEKHKFLAAKSDELQKFILSSDGTKEKISLSNASGFKFDVSNSQTIEKVLTVIQSELDMFMNASEKEIVEFSI